jgi:hypothetical protein
VLTVVTKHQVTVRNPEPGTLTRHSTVPAHVPIVVIRKPNATIKYAANVAVPRLNLWIKNLLQIVHAAKTPPRTNDNIFDMRRYQSRQSVARQFPDVSDLKRGINAPILTRPLQQTKRSPVGRQPANTTGRASHLRPPHYQDLHITPFFDCWSLKRYAITPLPMSTTLTLSLSDNQFATKLR